MYQMINKIKTCHPNESYYPIKTQTEKYEYLIPISSPHFFLLYNNNTFLFIILLIPSENSRAWWHKFGSLPTVLSREFQGNNCRCISSCFSTMVQFFKKQQFFGVADFNPSMLFPTINYSMGWDLWVEQAEKMKWLKSETRDKNNWKNQWWRLKKLLRQPPTFELIKRGLLVDGQASELDAVIDKLRESMMVVIEHLRDRWWGSF